MPQLFRASSYADFKKLQCSRLADSSYKHITFPLGCSRSEFQMNFDDREVSLLDNKGQLIGFIRIKTVMHTHIYLDFFCIINDTQACAKSLASLQNHLINSYRINKFFVQLLEHENFEQQALEHNSYEKEALLSKHIWLNGAYRDIYIYGSQLYV